MNKNLLFIALLIMGIQTQAQTKFHFPDSNASWNIANGGTNFNVTFRSYGIMGDTSLNGLTYKKIGESTDTMFKAANANYFCAVREDSNKWYFVNKNDSINYLLYNFSAKIGDTIIIKSPWLWGDSSIQIVSKIDSILIHGNYRKRISFDPNSYVSIIEGIGSNYGLFYNGWGVFDYGFILLCFHQNDSLIWMNNPENNCYNINLGISTPPTNTMFNIYPNPAGTFFQINYEGNIYRNLTIELYDLAGKQILTQSSKSNSCVLQNTHSYKGIYVIKLWIDGNPMGCKKIIFE